MDYCPDDKRKILRMKPANLIFIRGKVRSITEGRNKGWNRGKMIVIKDREKNKSIMSPFGKVVDRLASMQNDKVMI